MNVGIKTGQGGYTFNELSQVWQKADTLGFDSAWLYDHFVALGNPEAPCLEAYATLAALARDTKRLRIGVMATCVAYRSPSYLAKLTSTIDVISEGRLIVGMGACWNEAEFKAYGFEFLSGSERVQQLREAVAIVRAMWREDKATFKGSHYAIEGAVNIPKPAQTWPPIWVGISQGTKVLPRLAVQEADGFNTVAEPAICRQMIDTAERERERIGRARTSVTYSVQAFVLTGSEQEIQEIAQVESHRAGMSAGGYLERLKERGWLIGSPADCAERLHQCIETGIDYFLLVIAGDRLGWPLEIVKDRLLPLLSR